MGVINGVLQARRANGSLSDGREAMDMAALFGELKPEDRIDALMPADTRIGHFHLYVSDLEATLQFYHGLLGFDDMGLSHAVQMGMVSAGGYHHHIGFNTWIGAGAPPAQDGSLGMRYFTFVLPGQIELDLLLEHVRQAGLEPEQNEAGWALRDPSQNLIVFSVV